MNGSLISKNDPMMNSFLFHLKYALENVLNNPKPLCEGFYLAYYDEKKDSTTIEKIGVVPEDKKSKYRHFASKKVTQTLLFGANRSKDFEDNNLEQYPGAIKLHDRYEKLIACAGVSGHDSMIDEAISALWLLGKRILDEERDCNNAYASSPRFFGKLKYEAVQFQAQYALDNQWIVEIVEIMANHSAIK